MRDATADLCLKRLTGEQRGQWRRQRQATAAFEDITQQAQAAIQAWGLAGIDPGCVSLRPP